MASKKGKFLKGGRYAKELERLRELNAINEVLKKGDIENAALTNASKDSEVVSDSSIDNMLDQLNIDRNSSKDLEIVEGLTGQSRKGIRPSRRSSAKPARKPKANRRKQAKRPRPRLKGKKKR